MSVIRRILVYYKFSMRINQAKSHQVRDLIYLTRFKRVEDLPSIEVFPIIPRYSIMFAAFALASPDSNMIAELVHQLNKAPTLCDIVWTGGITNLFYLSSENILSVYWVDYVERTSISSWPNSHLRITQNAFVSRRHDLLPICRNFHPSSRKYEITQV